MSDPSDVPSFGDKVRYQVDRFLSWSPIARFVGLFGLSFLLVSLNAVFARIAMPAPAEGEEAFDFLEAMWWALGRVADAGTMGDDKGTLVRGIAIFTTLCGVGVVALLIGLVSSTIGDKIEDLRKGKSPVIDENHTLILGYGEKIFAILRELREANSNQPHASIVILSPAEKEEVETAVMEGAETAGKEIAATEAEGIAHPVAKQLNKTRIRPSGCGGPFLLFILQIC